MLSLLPVAGSALGMLAGAFQKQPELVRREETYNPEAARGLRDAQARTSQINPAATAQAANQLVASGRDAAIGSALNMAAGQTATAGDFGSPMAAAVAGSQAASAAASPFAQQMAANLQQVDQTRLQQSQQLTGIANSIGNLSNNVSYERTPQPNTLLNVLNGAQAGANGFTNIMDLLNNKTRTNQASTTGG